MTDGVFEQYRRLRERVRYRAVDGGEAEFSALAAELRGADPLRREKAWKIICDAWEPCRAGGALLLERASREKPAVSAAEYFGVAAAPILAGAAGMKPRLHKALKEKAVLTGADDFRLCDLWALTPAGGDGAMPFADALPVIEKIFDGAFEGGSAFVREFAASGRLLLEGDRPHCVTPRGGGPALVYLPGAFKKIRPEEIPTAAHELCHAMHYELAARLAPGNFPGMIFAELFSQLIEELAWSRLEAEAPDEGRRLQLELGRVEQGTLDLLVMPMLLELEETLGPSAKSGGLTLEGIEAAQDKAVRNWLGVPAGEARFWLRTERLFNPELPFDSFVYIAGRALAAAAAEKIKRGGPLTRAALEDLVLDTVSLDLKAYLAKHS